MENRTIVFTKSVSIKGMNLKAKVKSTYLEDDEVVEIVVDLYSTTRNEHLYTYERCEYVSNEDRYKGTIFRAVGEWYSRVYKDRATAFDTVTIDEENKDRLLMYNYRFFTDLD